MRMAYSKLMQWVYKNLFVLTGTSKMLPGKFAQDTKE
jgi:hypothetical protein